MNPVYKIQQIKEKNEHKKKGKRYQEKKHTKNDFNTTKEY